MGSFIHNFDRESLLMFYIAGELPADDQAELEAMLATDSALRAQYEQMRSEQQAMATAFEKADADLPLPAPAISSVRRVGSAMKQWQVDRSRKPAEAPTRRGLKFGWLYATAASLVIVVGTIFILWSRVDDGKAPPIAIWPDDNASNTTPASTDKPTDTVAVATPTPDPDDYTPARDQAMSELNETERELATLSTLSDSLRPTEEAVTP